MIGEWPLGEKRSLIQIKIPPASPPARPPANQIRDSCTARLSKSTGTERSRVAKR